MYHVTFEAICKAVTPGLTLSSSHSFHGFYGSCYCPHFLQVPPTPCWQVCNIPNMMFATSLRHVMHADGQISCSICMLVQSVRHEASKSLWPRKKQHQSAKKQHKSAILLQLCSHGGFRTDLLSSPYYENPTKSMIGMSNIYYNLHNLTQSLIQLIKYAYSLCCKNFVDCLVDPPDFSGRFGYFHLLSGYS